MKSLVDGYEELLGIKDTNTRGQGLRIIHQLVDLDRAIAALPPGEDVGIWFHGLLRHSVRDAASLVGVSKTTLHEWYESGLDLIVRFLNGDE